MSHDLVFGAGHYAFRKTLQRIQTSFWWPSMRADVGKYTSSCKECQLRRRVTVFDRVPISAVMRPAAFGDVVSVDILGPVDPPSSSGKRYILVAIDQATKWPECVCLNSVSAKETCNALLKIFSRIGTPLSIVSDNCSNFTAAVTKELFTMLGVKLRTSSPFHAEGNSLIERLIQTIKKMLRHIMASSEPRSWEKNIEYLLWSYRSIPHATLGVSPYQMVYGRLPRGPLSVLKDNMTGSTLPYPYSCTSIQEFCEKVVDDIKIGHDLAKTQCDKAQSQYVNNYNTRSKDKSFSVGDEVIV